MQWRQSWSWRTTGTGEFPHPGTYMELPDPAPDSPQAAQTSSATRTGLPIRGHLFVESSRGMAKLTFHATKPYFSTLTKQYYPEYDAAFHDSLRNGGGAEVDFNICYVHRDGTAEIVF